MSLVNSFQGHFNEINKINNVPLIQILLQRVPMTELLKYGLFHLHSIGLLLQTYLNHSSGMVRQRHFGLCGLE
jgi:hypothetical protein